MPSKTPLIVPKALTTLLCLACLAPPRAGALPQPPAMPAVFDRATVQGLVDNIAQGHNAAILKIGYFLRRGHPALPTADGFAILTDAAGKEPVGTRRWYLLESVRGFAALRASDIAPADGYKSYDAIFDSAASAEKAGASGVVRQAITEYVYAVPSRLKEMHIESDPAVQDALLKAWNAHLVVPPPTKPVSTEPPWSDAIDVSESDDAFRPLLTKELHDPAVPKTYGFYKALATLSAGKDRPLAITLLQSAKPLLPATSVERTWYYSTLVDWLVAAKKPADAIAAQREYVKLTGHGQAGLARLCYDSGDTTGFNAVAAALSAPDADEHEINDFAAVLDDIYSKDPVRNKAYGERENKLLSDYLASSRDRDIEQELRARKELGGLLIQQGKVTEAKAVLAKNFSTQSLTTVNTTNYYHAIEQMRSVLNKSTYVMP